MDIIEIKGNTEREESIGMFIKTETETSDVSEPNKSCGERTDTETIECEPEVRHVNQEKYKNNKKKDTHTGGSEIRNVRQQSTRKVKRKVDDNFEYIATKHTETSRRQSKKSKPYPSKSNGEKNPNEGNRINKLNELLIKQVHRELEQLQVASSTEIITDDAADENLRKNYDSVLTKTPRGNDEDKGGREEIVRSEIELESPDVSEPNNSAGEKTNTEDTEYRPEIRYASQNHENNESKDEDAGRGGTRSMDIESNVRRQAVRKVSTKVDVNFENVKTGKHAKRRKSERIKSLKSTAKKEKLKKLNQRILIENDNEQFIEIDSVKPEHLQTNCAEEHVVDDCADQNYKNSYNIVPEVKTENMNKTDNAKTDKDNLANGSSNGRELHKNLILCNYCDTSFETEKAAKKHLIETHNVKLNRTGGLKEKKHECTYEGCEKKFENRWSLKKHIDAVHLDIRKYPCDICGFRFRTHWHLKSHISRRHTEDKERQNNVKKSGTDRRFRYKCTEEGCPTQFGDKAARRKHVNAVHLNIRKHQCEFCGFRFKTGSALKVHLPICNPKGKRNTAYTCEICGKSFFVKWRLKTHETVHTNTKIFTCSFDNCGKTFRLKCGLRRHEMVHTDEKPFQCGICKEGFRRKSYLETHKYKHTGLKNYSCDICFKTFSQNGNLKVHKLIHDKDRPVFKCEKCSYKSNFKSNFTKHLQQHDVQDD